MAWSTVPVYSQPTEYLCWEACARMMWHWRYRGLAKYTQKAGNWTNRNTGLYQLQMDLFYRQLGLRSLQKAKGANVRHALKWTPVIFTDIGKVAGHAMVTIGYNDNTGAYTVINPCALLTINFDEHGGSKSTCTGGTVSLPKAKVEGSLGSYIWYW